MNVRTFPPRAERAGQPEPNPPHDGKNAPDDLSDLLEETRILLPGTQVFAGFLITLPFQSRFDRLTAAQRNFYLVIVVTVLIALICFIAPAAYHRIARPVHRKQAYKVLATWFVIVGLVPFSVSTILTTYFIMDVVAGPGFGVIVALLVSIPILLLWWLFPILRVHDHVPTPELDE
jgi:Family of unknown function (DUF6328)